MRGLPQPPSGFALLDPPPALLIERTPSDEGDWQPHETRRHRFAGPLSPIDEIERMAREVAEYWDAMPERVDRPAERPAATHATSRGGHPPALPSLDTRDYRPPDFRPTDYRGEVGDIGFAGLRDDEEPVEFSPEHLAAWDSSIAQMQVAFDQGDSRGQLVARARGLRIPVDGKWLSNLDTAIANRARGHKVQWIRDPRSFAPPPPDISDMRGGREQRDKALMDLARRSGLPPLTALAYLGTEGGDAAVRSAANTLTAGLADHVSAGLNTLGGGTYAENLRRERAINAYDWEHHPWDQIGGMAAGAVILPTRAPQAAMGAARTALRGGLGRAEAIVAARRAGTRRAALEGGGYGAVHGAAEQRRKHRGPADRGGARGRARRGHGHGRRRSRLQAGQCIAAGGQASGFRRATLQGCGAARASGDFADRQGARGPIPRQSRHAGSATVCARLVRGQSASR